MHPLIEAILSHDSYVQSKIPRSLSATTLLSPIQKVLLSKRHESSIDIKLNSASMLGVALHEYWESIVPNGFAFELDGDKYELIHQELSMNAPIGNTGMTLTGTSDLVFFKNGSLIHIGDYKSCKDYSLKKKDFSKWQQQLSIYSLLTHLTLKKPVDTHATVFYFNKSAEATSNFPFGTIVLELMTLKETRDFIMERALEFKKYWEVSDNDLPRCSQIDNWNGRLCGTYCGYPHVCQQLIGLLESPYNF